MPIAYRNYRLTGLVYKVHIRSGQCNEYNRRNLLDYNIRISKSKQESIKEEKIRLQRRLEEVKKEEQEIYYTL